MSLHSQPLLRWASAAKRAQQSWNGQSMSIQRAFGSRKVSFAEESARLPLADLNCQKKSSKQSEYQVPRLDLKAIFAFIWWICFEPKSHIPVSSHCEAKSRVRIGLLVQGVQDGFEHIRTSLCRNYIFSKNDQIVHFDDVVDYEDLNSCMTKSNFLTGPVRNSFLVHVIIVPLSERSTLDI